jgi:hypothetical protein
MIANFGQCRGRTFSQAVQSQPLTREGRKPGLAPALDLTGIWLWVPYEGRAPYPPAAGVNSP